MIVKKKYPIRLQIRCKGVYLQYFSATEVLVIIYEIGYYFIRLERISRSESLISDTRIDVYLLLQEVGDRTALFLPVR